MDQGYEESLVHRGGGIGQPSDPPGGEGRYTDPVLFRNGQREEMKGYCTDVYFDAAFEFMEQAVAEGRPFFAYVPTNAPHGPFHDVPDDWLERYRQMDLSAVLPNPEQASDELLDRLARTFAMISNVDDNVGRLMARLDETGLAENTIVVFLNDNGPASDRYNAGLRGRKGSTLEGRNLIVEMPEVAAEMRDAYLAWFEDVSNTRPDNYAPPRIVVGTDHEPVTVLTRQDWRRVSQDQGWRPTSQGQWLLNAREDSTFDVEVRLVAGSTGPLRLDIGDHTFSQDLAPEQRIATFEAVAVVAGDFALSASAGESDDRRGAHQVVLSSR